MRMGEIAGQPLVVHGSPLGGARTTDSQVSLFFPLPLVAKTRLTLTLSKNSSTRGGRTKLPDRTDKCFIKKRRALGLYVHAPKGDGPARHTVLLLYASTFAPPPPPRDPRVWEWDHAGLLVPEDLGFPVIKFGENEISAKKGKKEKYSY